ncbi:unnamed protein product [Camellia sinensis]
MIQEARDLPTRSFNSDSAKKVLTTERCNTKGSMESLNLRNRMFQGNRYESTSNASDTPVEKYECQTEWILALG